MRLSALVPFAVAAFLSCPGAAQAPTEEAWTITAEFVLTCQGPSGSSLKPGGLLAALPTEDGHQRVLGVSPSAPSGVERADLHDGLGNRYALFRVPALKPGQSARFRWVARVRFPARPGAIPDVSDAEQRRRELFVGPPFSSGHPKVQEVVTALGAGDVARGANALLAQRLRHASSGALHSVPEVFRRGRASGSEAAYALIAVCRARGVRARWAGGTRGPVAAYASFARGSRPATDRRGARWVEIVRAAGGGWERIDPRLATTSGTPREAPTRRLTLCRGDGLAGAPLGHRYVALPRVKSEGGAKARFERSFTWRPSR